MFSGHSPDMIPSGFSSIAGRSSPAAHDDDDAADADTARRFGELGAEKGFRGVAARTTAGAMAMVLGIRVLG